MSADPGDHASEAELLKKVQKLSKINEVLMDRVERSMDRQGNAFSLFQTAIMLEGQVRSRTEELTLVLRSLERINAQLTAAKEEAEKANLSKTRFLAAASHDLLQPVISAKLSISTLAEMQESPGGKRLALQVESSLQTIEDLIKTLLDISKLDAGVVTPEVRCFPLDDLLAGLHATFEGATQSTEIRLKVRPCGLAVESDPVLLQRVLLNLVSNAIHYTVKGGVLVGVRRRGTICYLDIVDTGLGIPECEQQRIFDEFYRGSTSVHGNQAGLGLGLSIVKRITVALGHDLSLKSSQARGSRFRIAIPVVGTVAEQTQRSPCLPLLPPLSGIRVLIVENDPPAAKAMQRFFEQWGCQTAVASGLTGVDEHLSSDDRLPDVVVADYHLDNNDLGVAAIAAARALDPAIPALVVTADHSEETAREVRAAGALLLQKPVSPGRLRASVSHLLAKRAQPQLNSSASAAGEMLRSPDERFL
ncbi:MAG: hybrid sensor histidine kinase/response regulator [Rhodomicrobium sp.]